MTDTRTSLLDAAEYATRKRGLDGFSYADLSAEVGIRKASIHHHFPAKSDLAVAIMKRYGDRHFEALATVEQSVTAAKGLSFFIDRYRDASPEADLICLCVAFSLSRESLSNSLREEIRNFQERSLAWLVNRFSAARADNSVADLADPDSEAVALLALLEGAQILARTAGDQSYFDRAVASFYRRLTVA